MVFRRAAALLKLPGLDRLGRLRFPENIADKPVDLFISHGKDLVQILPHDLQKVTVADPDTLAGICNVGPLSGAGQVPVFLAFPLIDRSAGAERMPAASADGNAGENAFAHVVVFLIIPSSFSEIQRRSVKCLLRNKRQMRAARDCPIFLRDGELLFGTDAGLSRFAKQRMPEIDLILEDPLDRRIIPKIRGVAGALVAKMIAIQDAIFERRNDPAGVQLHRNFPGGITGGRRGKNSLHDRRGHLIRDELMHIVRILFVAIRWTGTVLPALTLVFQNVFDLA